MITGYDEPMFPEVADLHERDGNECLAWINRLTPDEAAHALAYLHGWDHQVFQMLVDRVEEQRERARQRRSTAPVPVGKDA